MKVQIKIAGLDRGIVPLEFVALALARARSTVRVAKPALDRDGMTHSEPIVHPAIRRENEVEAIKLLLREAQQHRLRVCDSGGVERSANELIETPLGRLRICNAIGREVPATDVIEATARIGEVRFKSLDDETRAAILAGSREVEPGSGVSIYEGPHIELEPDPDATKLAALYTTTTWLEAWGKDRGLDFSVEFSGAVFPTANGWGGVPRSSDVQPAAPATGLSQAERLQAPQSDLSDASKTSEVQPPAPASTYEHADSVRAQERELGGALGPSAVEPTPSPRRHRLGRDLLAHVIVRARTAAGDASDSAEVMAQLEKLARLPDATRPPPLVGVTSGGVQWLNGGVTKVLTRQALWKRLKRLSENR